MQTIDLRIDAAWIVPVEPAGTLTGHALIVDAGKIVAVLSASDADARFAPRERVQLPEHVLIPGLVNAHTHSAMTLMRGRQRDGNHANDDAPRRGPLRLPGLPW